MSAEDLRSKIREIPDFPKPGILFYDITTLLKDAAAYKESIDLMLAPYAGEQIDLVVGMESRGFIFSAPMAYQIDAGLVPVRKLGKLPAETITVDKGNRAVTLNMGSDSLTIKMGNQTTKINLGKSETEAMQSIELKVGQSSIKLDQTGVTIKGIMIKVEGQAMTQVKAPMTQVNGDGMLMLKGGLTMIN